MKAVMKIKVSSLIMLCGMLSCPSCTNPESDIPTPSVTINDSVTPGYVDATISLTVSGNVTAESVIIEYSTDEGLSSSTNATIFKKGDSFTTTITSLEPQTVYYYRYTVKNRLTSYPDNTIRHFTTLEYKGPSVATVGVEGVNGTSAVLMGELVFSLGEKVLERGFMVGKNPSGLEAKTTARDVFKLEITGLEFGILYYYQAYVKTEKGVGEGEIKSFTTLNGVPEITTSEVKDITANSATLSGEITYDGGSTITERGFCYSEVGNPTVSSSKVTVGGTTGAMTRTITGLSSVKQYYVRAYAVNGAGIHYGNEVSFTTSSIPVSSITLNKTSLTLEKGSSETLTATVTPSDAADKTVTWSSSNTSVVTVSNGTVTAIAGGSATITAKAGDKTATCTVTVTVPVNGISVSPQTVSLIVGQTATLTATVSPSDATDKTVTWVSSNTSVATVSSGTVTANAAGSATITASAGGKTATCSVTVANADNGPEAVDLGLSVKWASCNIGASKPEEYGNYYAWGETETKSNYDWSTYKWCNGSSRSLTKYNTNSSYGTVDNKTTLENSDDVACVKLGGKWRMPTTVEWLELSTRSKCTWTWTTQNGVRGYRVTSKINGNSIFLPAAGFRSGTSLYSAGSDGCYWSSFLNTDDPGTAYDLSLTSSGGNSHDGRYYGLSVRPVYADFVSVTSVSLNMTSLSLTSGETQTLTAAVSPDNATDKSVKWSSNNTSVATVSSSGVVTTIKAGSATITVKTNDGGKTATCSVTVTDAYVPEAVDLGLSVKWASFNIGASKPEEYGKQYPWGETETKSVYDWSTYKWCNGTENSLTKYNTSSSYGTVDNKTTLENSDDVAHMILGGGWRMPTYSEWTELRTKCTWTWTTQNGVYGRRVTGPNGNSIFLPAAGSRSGTSLYGAGSIGGYWSSSLHTDYPSYPYQAYSLDFSSDIVYVTYNHRYYGLSVRPVSD